MHIVSSSLLSGKVPHIDFPPDSRMSSTGPVHNEKLKTTDPHLLYTRTNIALYSTLLVKDVNEMQQSEPGYNDNDLYDISFITSNILWFNSLVYFSTLKLYANLQL